MYKLFNFNSLQKKHKEKERRRDSRVKHKMCLNRKQKMHMCTFWQKCTVMVQLYNNL